MGSKKALTLKNQLIRAVILPLLLTILALSALQAYLYYDATMSHTRQQLEQRVDLMMPVLSKALYDADKETVNLIGDSLFEEHYVSYLMISDQFSRLYLRSRTQPESMTLSPVIISKPLSFTNEQGQRLLLGNLTVHHDPLALLADQQQNHLDILGLAVLKFILPLLALLVFLTLKVQRPIARLIDAISNARPDRISPLEQRHADTREIQALTSAYNQLQENNFRYHSRQKEAHAKLIERTREVAEGRESARLLTNMLQNSQKRYRALFHRNVDALLIVESFRLDEEEHYRIIDANQAAMDILNQPLDQLIKQDFEVMFGSPPLEHGRRLLDKEQLPATLRASDLMIELHFNMVMYDKQGLYYVTLRDVSDKVRAEQLQKEADELMNYRQNQMAIAEMATTIAHEINQPLAAIQNYALSAINFSRQNTPDTEKLRNSLEFLIQQSDIASDIVRQARRQLGGNDYPQQALDLVIVLQQSLDLCRLRADKNAVTLHFNPQPSDQESRRACVIANEVQIKQLMINLISNAIEALSESRVPDAAVRVSLSRDEHGFLIQVSDNGPGIANISQVFTTHFSTKEKGLGMGLSICRSIAEMHHGSLTAHNPETGGARFDLILPAADDTALQNISSQQATS